MILCKSFFCELKRYIKFSYECLRFLLFHPTQIAYFLNFFFHIKSQKLFIFITIDCYLQYIK